MKFATPPLPLKAAPSFRAQMLEKYEGSMKEYEGRSPSMRVVTRGVGLRIIQNLSSDIQAEKF